MTLKRMKKLEQAQKKITEAQQETTHSLVSKFSKEMINLIKEKETAVLVSPLVFSKYSLKLIKLMKKHSSRISLKISLVVLLSNSKVNRFE